MYSNIAKAVQQLNLGKPVIILDDNNRENEADLVLAAETIDKYAVNFMVKHSSGVICIAITPEQADKLKLERVQSPYHQQDELSTPFTYTCEAKDNITTGISATDRATSIKVIANPNSTYKDIVVPGHILPLKAHPNGLKGRKGHTEASLELCKLANLWPAAAIVELNSENATMLKGEEVAVFASTYNIPVVTVQQIEAVLDQPNRKVFKTAAAKLPTVFGNFNISIWQEFRSNKEHIALTMGKLDGEPDVPVRIHSQCLTGDVFGSIKCDCGDQLHAALTYMATKGKGILVWLRQEGRGIGLTNKIKAYALQDKQQLDTVEANIALNLPVDSRNFDEAVEIIKYFNPTSIELLTNNPQKLAELEKAFTKVTRKELLIEYGYHNLDYLKVKQTKLNHMYNLNKVKTDVHE